MFAVTLLAGVACDSSKSTEDNKSAEAEQAQQADKDKQDNDEESSEKEAANKEQSPHSSSIPGTQNQLLHDDDVPDVQFKLTSPEQGETLDANEVSVEFDLKNYRVGKEIGQHIHMIIDNKPYVAHYEDGTAEVFKDLEPGTHLIRAFPARHYHMSLKGAETFDMKVFHVKEKSTDWSFDPEKPLLTYSRPKGTYSREAAKNLLLDFYVTNVTLGEDAKVVYSVDGEKQGELTEWKPVLLPELSSGEHDITLELVTPEGEPIKNGGFNKTMRTITVK
jgi:hypothetical protein